MAQLLLQNLSKTFGNTPAVASLHLEIRDGEFLVLVGPSGCGKTTVLRMIAGLTEPSTGEIWIGDREVSARPPRDRDVAMVFQNYALYPHMSVFDNLAFGLQLRRLPRAEIRRRVEDVAALLGLGELLLRKPAQLSGGQRQRVALGRAIVREPAAFLMDEPLSNLDANLRVQTRAELIRLHRRLGITTVYVTHDQVEAMTMANRMAVMRDGHLQQVGTPQEIYERPANRFVAQFVGSPPMNFLPGHLHSSAQGVTVQTSAFTAPLPVAPERLAAALDRPVLLGLRPADVHERSRLRALSPGAHIAVQAQVQVVETLGSEALLYLDLGGVPLVATVPTPTQARMDAPLEVVLDLARAHLFDPITEESLV